jgi:hypothetical protein
MPSTVSSNRQHREGSTELKTIKKGPEAIGRMASGDTQEAHLAKTIQVL